MQSESKFGPVQFTHGSEAVWLPQTTSSAPVQTFVTPITKLIPRRYLELEFQDTTQKPKRFFLCVDQSSSMNFKGAVEERSAIAQINCILRDLYAQYPKTHCTVIGYNHKAITMSLAEASQGLKADGYTSFESVFNVMAQYMRTYLTDSLVFLFMTDGEDTCSKDLSNAIQLLRWSARSNRERSVVLHVLGLGDVQESFLEQVRCMGNNEGTLQYASKAAGLVQKIADMFVYGESTEQYALQLQSKNLPPQKVQIPNVTAIRVFGSSDLYRIETLLPAEATLPSGISHVSVTHGTHQTMIVSTDTVQELPAPSALDKLKALEHFNPQTEDEVRALIAEVKLIVPKGLTTLGRCQFYESRGAFIDRLMEHIWVYNQIKSGKVDEQSKLRLKDLSYQTQFTKARRNRVMDMRRGVNLDRFLEMEKTLATAHSRLSEQDKTELGTMSEDWRCILSLTTPQETICTTVDDFMCLGLLVERDELVVDAPSSGLRLKSVSSSVLSYNTFLDGMAWKGDAAHGGFTSFNEHKQEEEEAYCFVGQAKEKINAVIPLYLHPKHMERVQILKPSWLGYLYTLDPFGYSKDQEIGLLNLYGQMVIQSTGTAHNALLLHQVEAVCSDISISSQFRTHVFTDEQLDKFISDFHFREPRYVQALLFVLVLAHLRGRLEDAIGPVYYEYVKRTLRHQYSGDNLVPRSLSRRLLYGDKPQKDSVFQQQERKIEREIETLGTQLSHLFDTDAQDLTSVNLPKASILEPQYGTVVDAKDVAFLVSDLLPKVPSFIIQFLTGVGRADVVFHPETNLEETRKHLLLSLFYNNDYAPSCTTLDSILDDVHERFVDEQDNKTRNSVRTEEEAIVAKSIAGSIDLPSFAVLLRRFCPTRNGAIFYKVVDALVHNHDKDKLLALLKNEVKSKPIYKDYLQDRVWIPFGGLEQIKKIRNIVGAAELSAIEREHVRLGRWTGHLYRASDLPNRHGHCNSKPNPSLMYPFRGWSGQVEWYY